jgi:hypothetical protein
VRRNVRLSGDVAVQCAVAGEAVTGFDKVGGVVRRLASVNGLTEESTGDVTAQGMDAVGLEVAEAGTFDVHGSYP